MPHSRGIYKRTSPSTPVGVEVGGGRSSSVTLPKGGCMSTRSLTRGAVMWGAVLGMLIFVSALGTYAQGVPCGQSPPPQCGGSCPAGFACQQIPGGPCECAPVTTPCEQSLAPQCGGPCPPGRSC